MITNAQVFFALCQKIISTVRQIEGSPINNQKISPTYQKSFEEFLNRIESDCKTIPLDDAIAEVKRTKSTLADCTYMQLAHRLANIYERMHDQLNKRAFFYLPDDRRSFYDDPRFEFGEVSCDVFHECLLDIEEAGKCYAFGRWTATVYHLMRIMEEGLKFMCAEASKHGITFPEHNNSWNSWLDPIDKQIKKQYKEKTSAWNGVEHIYAELAADLRNVSRAWRNKTMHVGTGYDQEQAGKIYSAVKHFMQDLAEKLKRS